MQRDLLLDHRRLAPSAGANGVGFARRSVTVTSQRVAPRLSGTNPFPLVALLMVTAPRIQFVVPFLLAATAAMAANEAGPVDFRRDVLPILSDACFKCHGPDEAAREARLRLDQRDGIFRTRDGVSVVTPGNPAASELVLRITSPHEDEVMPPRDSGRPLQPAEIATLRRWVAEGAPWSGHWAFEPLAKTPPPVSAAARDPIEAWIRDKLVTEKLPVAPEADRPRLLRRVTFDLTGLPPTPAEVDAFVADRSPAAYQKVVDRLLASPRYGERMAVEWLDLARFADTHGYQMDRPRDMSPWRDWVIRAYNENLPFDQFATWQLAGDLLPNATKTQRLATAFNRLHNQNEEGGVVEEEYRVAHVADRVSTFGTAFLGLTLECARCHDHRYDPISQRDFYAFSAFFQNIDEAGQLTNKVMADSMPLPSLLLTTDEQDKKIAALRAQAATAEQKLAQVRAEAAAGFETWLAARGELPATPPGLVVHYDFDTQSSEKPVNLADPSKMAVKIESPQLVTEERGVVVALDGENGYKFPGVEPFRRTTPFSLGIRIRPPAPLAARSVVLHRTKAPADAGSRGYEILLEHGRVAFGLHYQWPGGSIKVVSRNPVPADTWSHVTVTYDGSSRAAGVRLYIDGRPADVEVVRDGLFKDITYDRSPPDLTIGQRFRDIGFAGGRVDDVVVFNRALTPLEAAQVAGHDDLAQAWTAASSALTPAQRQGLREYFTAVHFEPYRAAEQALQQLREDENVIVMQVPEAMVMQEMAQPRKAYVLRRGAYDARGDEVSVGTPAALPPFPSGAPRNRLGLARWLVGPANPLLARVTVNRLWQQMFGHGLVETSDNFGLQGTPPSHPALLDWLAGEFINSGWDVKATLRRIALSPTYRRSSRPEPEVLARDPQNALLARGPARRLTAEMLRDQALAVSGLLVEKIGGPSVKPYQPPGLWEEIAMGKPRYDQGTGDDLHRRSLYSFWKRTVPPPAMMLFDAADRSVCTVKRQSTSTPLQALALLNDVQYVEAARRLGERALREGGPTADARIEWAFREVCNRPPAPHEVSVLRQLWQEQRAIFEADPAAAAALVRVGEAPTDETLPVTERAAAAVFAQALLNFDEALMRR